MPTGDLETARYMRALVKCVNNLAIQKFRSLTNGIFYDMCDFVCRAVRQSGALGYLGLKFQRISRGG